MDITESAIVQGCRTMAHGLAACVLSKVLLEHVLSVDAFALQWKS